VEITVLQQQICLGFIPMLPARKLGRALCLQCNQPVEIKQGGARFQAAFKAFKWTVRAPLHCYAGLIVCLAGLIALFGVTAYQDNHNPYTQPIDQVHLEAPKPGDLYEVSVNGAPGTLLGHTLVRVEEVKEGSVLLRWHRSVVPITQEMPFLRDFPTSSSEFEPGTVEILASRLKRKFIVRRGVKDEITEASGTVVATLRPRGH
jgi:hypothetical protein